ncbi:fatty acid desaturase family protein [Streptomyces violascens]|uniref:Fatty acid desaturase n=1 Tax=Streptomyces violascens TaxID=67381 RepID=A0ABQ3QWK4_9ACTN|nr:acyl-CoA desaturase [Streptomyces violascens]GHI41663.1 fatty acid desaturase [Streptomyces violascens]
MKNERQRVRQDHGEPLLSPEQLEQLGRELDAIRRQVVANLQERDAAYIRSVVRVQRRLEIAGRGLFFFGFFPPAWIAGVACLAIAKMLDNMEIGHNVLHGQYDWIGDPELQSKTFEWEWMYPAEEWRRSHNYEHHTYTNVLGKDRDIGYSVLRMSDGQPWHPYHLGNPLYTLIIMVFFEQAAALHDVQVDQLATGKRKWSESRTTLQRLRRKAGSCALKEYVLFPALTGPLFLSTLLGNLAAGLIRNILTFSAAFTGHTPQNAQTFTEQQIEGESRAHWYYRQLMCSANFNGGKLFHILTGHFGHQIEHHLFPDLPSSRLREIAPQVQALCIKYGLPYNTGPFLGQLGSAWLKVFTLALPQRTRRCTLSTSRPQGDTTP